MTKAQLVKTTEVVPYHDPAQHGQQLWHVNRAQQQRSQERGVKYGALIRRHLRSIVTTILGCLALSAFITFLMPPQYVAKTVVEILSVNPDFMNTKDIDPNTSASTMDSYLDTQTRLLTSQSVLDPVATTLLSRSQDYVREPAHGLSRLERMVGIKASKATIDSEIRKTLANIKVKPEGQSSLLSITVTGPSARLAADAANAIANQHIAGLQEARWATASQTTDFLTAQLNSQRVKLRQSEDDLQAYARKTGLVFTGGSDHESVGAEKLREVQGDLNKAESDRADKQAQMELIDSSPADALPRVLDDGGLREAKGHLAELRRQLADLSSLYTPNHYKVKEVQSQIASVEEEVKQEKAFILNRLRNDYKAAIRREALQRQEYDKQLALVTDQSSKEVGYNLLKREVDANRDLYNSMLQKIKEASVVAALRASNIRVVDRAKTPLSPDQPNGVLNGALGLVAGCMLSVLIVLLRERNDGSIRAAGQITKLMQLPELAIVPAARNDIRTQIASVNGSSRQLARMKVKGALPAASGDVSKDFMTSWRHTGSIVAESFRSAVASIIMWGRDTDSSHKVLVVTSAHSGAGKTTSVLNLGLGLVESGRRVLLIDGDLRIPRLGEIFGLEAAAGLTTILSEALHPTVASELIIETGLPNLHVLASGPRYMNVTELLHSEDLPKLLEHLRAFYDFILIDTPPALPLTDARLLGQHSDGVILVVRAGKTTIEHSLSVQHQFLQDGTHIFGSILNHWDARSEDPAYMNSYLKYAASAKTFRGTLGTAAIRRSAGSTEDGSSVGASG